MKTVIVLNQAAMGAGDPELAVRILKTFLQKAIAFQDLDALLFYNGGVQLTGADSPVVGELTMLEESGVDMVPCGTCLQAFGVEPAVGRVGSMDEIIRAMDTAEKVITL